MATVATNRITRSVNAYSVFESSKALVSTAITYNQGDLLFLDTTNHLIKPVTGNTDALTFLGIARVSIASGVLISPYQGTAVDAAQAISDVPGPQAGVIAKMLLKSGDVFVAGGSVYASSVDAQTVSSAGTNAIGIFQDAGLTASAGSQGNVYLKSAV